MKWIALLLPLLALAAQAETFAVIRGHVVAAKDDDPLPGVEVTLTGATLAAPRRAVTNAHGDFVIAAVPRGSRYELAAALLGFVPLTNRDIGGIAAGETVIVTGHLTLDPTSCSIGWWDVARRPVYPPYIEPLPRSLIRGVCL
jgi:Carboxypeptidase regulatory-like domain